MKKIITMLLIIFITINICYISRVYAAGLCTLNASFSAETTNPGKEVVLTISTTNINGGLSGVNVTLEYDESVLELLGVEKVDGWTIMQTENSFAIVTDNSEETTKTGNIGKIKLKVLDSAAKTKTSIKLTSVQATRDGATMEKLDDISKDLNIVKATSSSDSSNNGTNNEQNNEKDKEGNQGQSQGQSQNSSSSSKSNNTQSNANKNNSSSNSKSSTNTVQTKKAKTQNSKLPYTGSLSIGIGSVLIITIIAAVSYMKYIKYKDVK